MSLGRPKPPTKGGSAHDDEEVLAGSSKNFVQSFRVIQVIL